MIWLLGLLCLLAALILAALVFLIFVVDESGVRIFNRLNAIQRSLVGDLYDDHNGELGRIADMIDAEIRRRNQPPSWDDR